MEPTDKQALPGAWRARQSSGEFKLEHVGTGRLAPALAASALALHAQALEALKRDDFPSAQAPLSRLMLVLGPEHPARPSCLTTLAYIYSSIGRAADASRVAEAALALDPGLSLARRFLLAS